MNKKQHLIDMIRADEELGLYDEPKQETIEEAAERYWAKQPYNEDAFIEGAKWQQEQDKKCYHPLPYRLAKSDVNYECTLCGKFI